MQTNMMITSVEANDYLPAGYFRDNEKQLLPQEREAALNKGFIVKGVEGGSDTVYQYRIAADNAPKDIGDWAFRAVTVKCTEAEGRTWSNGQKGPMDADVTFLAFDIVEIKIDVLKEDARKRQAQAKKDSEAYSQRRTALNDLETTVKARLAKAPAADSKK